MKYVYSDYISFYDSEGNRRRINGPSYISRTIQKWFKNGKRHRIGGPASIGIDHEGYYIDYRKVIHRNKYCIESKPYNEIDYHRKLEEMGV